MAATITEADLDDPIHARAIVEIIDAYAREPQGGGAPLSDDVRKHLVDGLRAHPTSLVLLAIVDGAPVGAAVCQWGFSTFAARPVLNIHDLAVLPAHRGRASARPCSSPSSSRRRPAAAPRSPSRCTTRTSGRSDCTSATASGRGSRRRGS